MRPGRTDNPHAVDAGQVGAEPVGTVNTHNLSGAAHGGVEAAFTAHDGATGTAHGAATAIVNGFMPSTDKVKLDGVDPGANNYSHPNHTGDVTSAGDGAQTIAANAVDNTKLDDVAANTIKGRATTTGDPTDIDIEALQDGGTPAAADVVLGKKTGGDLVKFLGSELGGGPGASTFAALTDTPASYTGESGKLAAVNSAEDGLEYIDPPAGIGDVTSALSTVNGEVQVGDTTAKGIKGAGFQGADVATMTPIVPDGNLVASDGAQNLENTGLLATDVSGHIGATNVHFLLGGEGSATQASRTDHDHSLTNIPIASVTNLQTELDGKLGDVIDDTTPQLGGNLETRGNKIVITQSDDTPRAIIEDTASGTGAGFGFSVDGVNFDLADGAFEVEPGEARVWGTTVSIESLKHVELAGRVVHVTRDGALYGLPAADPGWDDSGTDITAYPHIGTALNDWKELTGLSRVAGDDVAFGEPVDVSAAIWTVNNTTNRTGTIEIGFGINGADPTLAAQSYIIPELFNGYINYALRYVDAVLSNGDAIGIFVRVTAQSNLQFTTNLVFDGGVGVHSSVVSVPAEGGAGTGNVVGPPSAGDTNLASFNGTTGKEIEDSNIPTASVVRTDASSTIGQIGYPLTPWIISADTISPSAGLNFAWVSTRVGALTVDLTQFTADGVTTVYVEATVTAVTFSPTTPDITDGIDPGTGVRRICVERANANFYATWSPSG